MVEAYKRVVFQSYANFSGRAARPEYWWFTLANLIIFLILAVLSVALAGVLGEGAFAIMVIYWIAALIPALAVTVRRLHDTNKSAWWLLIGLIPWIAGIIMLIFMVLSTHPNPNKYGNPEGWQDIVSA